MFILIVVIVVEWLKFFLHAYIFLLDNQCTLFSYNALSALNTLHFKDFYMNWVKVKCSILM